MWLSISVLRERSLSASASDLIPLASAGSTSSRRNLWPFRTSYRSARRASPLRVLRVFIVRAVQYGGGALVLRRARRLFFATPVPPPSRAARPLHKILA